MGGGTEEWTSFEWAGPQGVGRRPGEATAQTATNDVPLAENAEDPSTGLPSTGLRAEGRAGDVRQPELLRRRSMNTIFTIFTLPARNSVRMQVSLGLHSAAPCGGLSLVVPGYHGLTGLLKNFTRPRRRMRHNCKRRRDARRCKERKSLKTATTTATTRATTRVAPTYGALACVGVGLVPTRAVWTFVVTARSPVEFFNRPVSPRL
jgi:hypothetical protein